MVRTTLVAVVLMMMMLLLPFDADRVPGPRLVTGQDLPTDVRRLTDQTWALFLEAFPGKDDCLGEVELLLVHEVEGGAAEYRRAERLIRIEIPTTPTRFPESLAHELGHHLESTCGAEREIRTDFMAAIGLGADADWGDAERWQDRPTEHFAEGVVQLVIGERHTHADLIDLSPTALAVVDRWARRPPVEAGGG